MSTLEIFRTALKIRLFEEKVDWLFSRGLLGGTTHLCIGQEGVAAGVSSALRPDDYVVSTHRGHGHLIARGAELWRIFAELLGRRDGYCMGKGGTQHLCVKELSFLGTNGITGGGIPIATGAALSAKLSGQDRISVCFFGDGASNQGTFHESLNMAAVWKLPVLYVCENNLYGMSTPFKSVSRFEDVAVRAASYGIDLAIVDGMDALRVKQTAAGLIERIRAGAGPALLEAKTYRYCGHSKSDPKSYRTRAEEAEWKAKDPVEHLRGLTGLSEPETADIEDKLRAEVDSAYARAEKGAGITKDEARSGAYADRSPLIPQGNI